MNKSVEKNNNSEFIELFIKREEAVIYGRKNKNFLTLMLIQFFTFLALGGANLGLDFLKSQMEDPFVQWLSIKVPWVKANQVGTYMVELNQDSLKKKFQYKNVTSHVEYPFVFWNHKSLEVQKARGRSIEIQNPLLQELLSEDNKILGRPFEHPQETGIIVTKTFLENFGYSSDETHIQMGIIKEKGYMLVPIPITAIIKEIPGLNEFAYTPYFFHQLTSGYETPFDLTNMTELIYFVSVDDDITFLFNEVKIFFQTNPLYNEKEIDIYFTENNESHINGKDIHISFFDAPKEKPYYDSIHNDLINDKTIAPFKDKLTRNYSYNYGSMPDQLPISYDQVSVNFASLDYVYDFKGYLFKQYSLEVDSARVRDKENFNTISNLTTYISFSLILFSLIGMGFYIYNLLKTHFEKIKMNLGTFKAFGLDNKTLRVIYGNLLFKFFRNSIILAIALCMILFALATSSLFGLEKMSIWSVWDWKFFLALILTAIVIILVFYEVTKHILNQTPGDLIYGRE